MPKVYSVVEVRSKNWAIMVGLLTFLITLSLVLGILWPIEHAKRKEAEQARERLTVHAHRLAQAKLDLQKELSEEKERKEAILALLRQTQAEVTNLQNQVTAQTEQLKAIQQASTKPSREMLEVLSKQKGTSVSLGKVVVGKETE